MDMDKKGGFPKIRESRLICANFAQKDGSAHYFNTLSRL